MLSKINSQVDPPVFWGANFVLFLLMICAVFFESSLMTSVQTLKDLFIDSLGGLYIVLNIGLAGLLLFVFFKFGDLKIGGEEAEPDFKTSSWLSMLFSAGLGTGLVYSGVFEPIAHFYKAPQIQSFQGTEKFIQSMDITFFHWGLSAWTMYSFTGLIFAILAFSLKESFQFSYFVPKRFAKLKALVNILAILSIIVGVVTTFVLASSQMSAGFQKILPASFGALLSPELMIVVITLMATCSVLSGLKRGIRILSELNIFLAFVLFLYVLFNVDFTFYFSVFFKTLGLHAITLPSHLFYRSFANDSGWLSSWTVLYWAWWTAWMPFVGLFIARISKGRTIRSYVLGTVVVPSFVTFLWFTLFGSAGYLKDKDFNLGLEGMLSSGTQNMLFAVLDATPFGFLFTVVALVCILIFYVTSSDSGSYVVDMIASGKKENHHPYLKVYWSLLEGALALILLAFGGVGLIKSLMILLSLPILAYIFYGACCLIPILKRLKEES